VQLPARGGYSTFGQRRIRPQNAAETGLLRGMEPNSTEEDAQTRGSQRQ